MEDTGFVGIGIASQMGEEGLTITACARRLPGPGGRTSGGRHHHRGGRQSAAGVEAATVTGWIQGEEGTRVTLACLRDGEAFTVTVERRPITLAATATELLEDHVAYLVCTTFGNRHHRAHAGRRHHSTAARRTTGLWTCGTTRGGLTQAAVQGVGPFQGRPTVGYLRDSAGTVYAYQQDGGRQPIEPGDCPLQPQYRQRLGALRPGDCRPELRHCGGRKELRQGRSPDAAGPERISRLLLRRERAEDHHTNRFYSPTGATTPTWWGVISRPAGAGGPGRRGGYAPLGVQPGARTPPAATVWTWAGAGTSTGSGRPTRTTPRPWPRCSRPSPPRPSCGWGPGGAGRLANHHPRRRWPRRRG